MDDRKGNSRISLEIILTKKQKEILINHAENSFPNESCALLFGNVDSKTHIVKDIFLTENIDNSPINFTVSNDELLRGYKEAEQKKMDVIGVFHSHPHSEAIPSATDRKFMEINPIVWVIFSNKYDEIKAFILESDIVSIPINTV